MAINKKLDIWDTNRLIAYYLKGERIEIMEKYIEWLNFDHGPRVAECGQEILNEGNKYNDYVTFLEDSYRRFDEKYHEEIWKSATTKANT
jgi:hypothetical protein